MRRLARALVVQLLKSGITYFVPHRLIGTRRSLAPLPRRTLMKVAPSVVLEKIVATPLSP
jgi:hypothetical protein